MTLLRSLAVLSLVVVSACQKPQELPVAPPPVDAPAAPLDLAAVVRQVHLGFRAEGPRFTGGAGSYSASLDAAALSFTATDAQRSATLTLETRDASKVPARLGRDGQLRLERGDVSEVFENTPAGVEQRWVFAQRPAGDRVRFELEARGLPYVGVTAGGLHFRSEGGVGVRYGHATWVDARGARTSVPARWADGTIVLEVPSSVVARSVFPAVLDPIISPELGMDEPIVAPAVFSQSQPRAAFNGTHWLVVWTDERTPGSADVYATRVSTAGVVLDVPAFAVSLAAGNQTNPSVASDGTDWLVVWTDGRFSTITDIYGARVTAAGAVLEQGGFVIDAAASHQLTPSVAYGGGNYFVAFQDNSGADQNIRAVRVTSGGALVPGSSVLISGAAGAQLGTDLVYGPQLDRFFVTWVDYRSGSLGQAYGQLVSGAGALVGGNLYLQGNGFPSVAWNAATQQFLAVWASGTSVWGALVSGSGLVPGGLLALSDPTGTGTKSSARVASNGADYFIAWDDRRNAATTGADLYGIRVAADGTRVSDVELVRPAGPSSQGDPWLGWEGSRYFLAWTDGRAGSSDVMANWLTSDGARVLSDDLALSFGVNQQRAAAATWDGTNYFVAWVDERNGGQDLYGVRLSPSGVALDPAGIAIATGPTNPSAPAVTWTGSHHLVVWSEARDGGLADLWAQRIAPDGGLEGPNFAVVSAPGEQLPPAIAAGPTSALVVWSDTRDGGQNLYGLRLAHDGGPLDGTGVPLAVAANVQHQPAVAWGTRTGSWCGKTSAPTPSVTSTARG